MVSERIAIDRHEYGIITAGSFTRDSEAYQVGVKMMNSSHSGHGATVEVEIDSCIPPVFTSRPTSWISEQAHRGGESMQRAWRSHPRDASWACHFLLRNLVTVVAVLLSGIVMWEGSTEEFRTRRGDTIVFPLYLPHAVSTSMATLWHSSVIPGNLVGLYLVKVYITERGAKMTLVVAALLFLVSVLATVQSHVVAFYLHKGLCKGRNQKKYPTIDTVADAVCFLVIVTVTSIIFSTFIALCVTFTPLANRRNFWPFWSTWWLGILASVITITPMIVHGMTWKCSPNLKRPGKVLEIAVTVVITLGLLFAVFFLEVHWFRPMPYLCFPLITYTALRFNRVGWAVTVTAVAYVSALGGVRRKGSVHAIAGLPKSWSAQLILQVQLFSIVMGVVSITLAAAVREKKSLTRRLHQMNRDLECTVECRTQQLLKTNEELQISQKAAEMASHAKSDFLANMSHEIRTPIHGILGLTALLLESELTGDQKESLVSVKECADLLLHIINSVLDLAKIEAGRLEVETVPFNVRKMVSSTFRMMEARALERGLKLCWDVDRAVPNLLAGDVGKLQQCLINLVGNALKFTHEGCISVHVRMAPDSLVASKMNAPHAHSSRMDTMSEYASGVAGTPESMFIHFEVRDTGIGINKEKLKDMFKPFTQADASTSRLYGGTGLGLCIVHRFVELLGGTIWVESEEGAGSSFHFCLPLVLSSATPSAEGSPRGNSPTKVYKKSWSLVDGLVFNPEYYPRAESTVISIDDLSAYVSRKRESSLPPLSNLRPCSNEAPTTTYSIINEPSRSHARRSSSSDIDAFKELRTARLRGPFAPRPGLNDHAAKPPSVIELQPSATLSIIDEPSSQAQRSSSSSDFEAFKELRIARRDHSPGLNEVAEEYHSVIELQPSTTFSIIDEPPSQALRSSSSDFEAFKELRSARRERPGLNGVAEGYPSSILDLERPSIVLSSVIAPAPSLADHDDVAEAVAGASGTPPFRARRLSSEVSSPGFSVLSGGSSTELESLLLEKKLRLRILLAEDNPINQKVASRQLQKHGHEVTIVGDGQRALETLCAQHDHFDLVLMDVQMPVMDGLAATEQIRVAEAEKGWSRVPILGLTAHAIQGYQDTCLTHGMDGYLGKPFDIQQLLKTIGHMLPLE